MRGNWKVTAAAAGLLTIGIAMGTIGVQAQTGPKPDLHDGRLLTLDDTVEFFNVILGTQLTAQEKKDLVECLRAL